MASEEGANVVTSTDVDNDFNLADEHRYLVFGKAVTRAHGRKLGRGFLNVNKAVSDCQ